MTSLFNLEIYTKGRKKLLEEIKERNEKNEKVHIISGNAEVLKFPLRDKEIFNLFKDKKNIIIPDGISVYLPVKKRKTKDIERIAGIDLMQDVLEYCNDTNKRVYFLGAKDEVLKEMVSKVEKDYPKLIVSGCHHGYIDVDNCSDIIEDINNNSPYVLFVAMGTPMQEKLIFNYMNSINCSLYMGVGGSFDVLSGKINRCPEWISKVGMEWFYRMVKDPTKIKRLWNNLYFTLKGIIKG